MVHSCTAVGCEHQEKTVLFKLPRKRPDLKEHWMRFLIHKNELNDSTIPIYEKHFEDKFINKDNDNERDYECH